MKKFAVLCIAILLAYQVSGASLPVVGDDLAGIPGVIDKAVGLVSGLTGSIGKLPGDLIKGVGGNEKKEGGSGLDLGSILKGIPLLG